MVFEKLSVAQARRFLENEDLFEHKVAHFTLQNLAGRSHKSSPSEPPIGNFGPFYSPIVNNA